MKNNKLRDFPVHPIERAPFFENFQFGTFMQSNSAAATRHLPLPPSYKALKAAGQARFSEKLGDGVVRNRISALNAWMRFLGARDNDIVGTEFDVNFAQTLERFQSHMLDVQLLKARTVEDRLLILRSWHAVVIELAANTELPDDFREALHEAMLRRQVSLKELAIRTGISTVALRYWVAGERRPTRDAENNLKKVERALRLPEETLTADSKVKCNTCKPRKVSRCKHHPGVTSNSSPKTA